MIKRVVIELDRDPNLHPEGNIVEVWSNSSFCICALIYLSSGPELLAIIIPLSTVSAFGGLAINRRGFG